jgi:signal transduction histidine kinase
MKLRTKLLLGYAGFVLALGILGTWSARTLSQMSAVSSRIIAENYDSVVAAQDMKESLERQDSAALFDLLGQRERAHRQVAEHRARFDTAFEKAAANITETGEPQIIEAIRGGRDDYYGRFDAFLAAPGDRSARYFADLEPRFNAVRGECDRLLRLNQEAMRRKADAASQIARRWLFLTLALAIGLMAAGIAIEISLSSAILGPVRELTAATTRVAAGDLSAAVPVRSSDEIGALATGFNIMAGRIRELREADYQDVSRLKAQFIQAASHELRAPVTDVQMGIHLLLEASAGPLSEAQLDILQTVRQSATRLDHLTRELLDLSILDGGTSKSARLSVRLSALVRDAVEPLRLKVEARGVQLVVDVPPDAPPVDVDRLQVMRVLVELVTNAAAATPAGGTITISAAPAGDDVAVSIADTGAGIARANHDRIFEPFVRASGASGGPGLGLPIARRIAETQGGRLTVESPEGRGAAFTLTLPRTIKARDL